MSVEDNVNFNTARMKSMIKCRLIWKEKGDMYHIGNEMSDAEFTCEERLRENAREKRGC